MHIEKYNVEEFIPFYKETATVDFKRDQLKPLDEAVSLIRENLWSCYVLLDFGIVLGYMIFSNSRKTDARLLEYFSINPQYRKKGLGSHLLRLVLDVVDSPVFIEAEDPDLTDDPKEKRIREKRIEFYRRNGVLMSDICISLYGGNYRILYNLPIHPTLENPPLTMSGEEIQDELMLIYEDVGTIDTEENEDIFLDEPYEI